MSDVQRPTVGRIVHFYYQRRDIPNATVEGPFAAMVLSLLDREYLTEREGCVTLRQFHPNSRDMTWYVPFDDSDPPKGNTWRWPPRV